MRDLSGRSGGRRRKSSSASHLGSLPGYRRREYDDGASDISSVSGFSAYGYRSSKEKKLPFQLAKVTLSL